MLPAQSLTKLAAPLLAGELLELVPDVVFFLKDRHGRYVVANQTLVERCGRRSKAELLGRTVGDLFPTELAARYAEQDAAVLHHGTAVANKLELHLYPNGKTGWCVTTKLPLRDRAGRIVGLVGLSRDLHVGADGVGVPAPLVETMEFLRAHFAEMLSPSLLAARAGLPPAKFARLTKRLLQLTPGQLIAQTRLQAAAQRLRDTHDSVAAIAHDCGFYDHSAFSRQFKATTGLAPLAYRQNVQNA